MSKRTRNRKEILSWALYDWANSSFATTVMAGFFPIFFKQFWSMGVDTTMSTARLGLANSIAGTIMALIAPVIGAIADRGTAKKKFLFFFAYMGIVMTSALYMVSSGNWVLAILCYVLAFVGFSGGNVFYDSLLTGITSEDRYDHVSSFGFALGYLGGGILFGLNVWMTLQYELFGFGSTGEAVQFSFLTVGAWWAVFSIPLLLFVREPECSRVSDGRNIVIAGLAQFRNTFFEIRHLKTIFLFLAAYWLYIDGVDTVIVMAVDYGISIGLQPNDLIIALLLTQFVGFPSAIGFGYVGSRIGAKKAVLMAIAVYFFVSVWGAFMKTREEFYVLAFVVGLVQGGVQSLSRSLYARIIPPEKSAEYFGFYNMIGKFATVLGPVFMGGIGLLVRAMGYSSGTASRISISSLSFFFIVGGTLLYFVDIEKGKKEARYLSQK